MGYDLSPRHKKTDGFHFGAFSFPVLLEACGYLFTCIQDGPQWKAVFGPDPRMGDPPSRGGSGYPVLISNDGFPVSAFEAKVMARVARNFVLLNRPNPSDPNFVPARPIREDFLDTFERFADWADTSGGFRIF